MSTAKYPNIKVQLTGHDGNAFAVLGRVREALQRNGVSAAEVQRFTDEATSGDYDQLLAHACVGWRHHEAFNHHRAAERPSGPTRDAARAVPRQRRPCSRIIVEKVGDDISVTVRHSGDPRDAETVVLSREVAHALLVALENVI